MNTNRIRIGLLGLASAVAGFSLQGCFAPQPLPECSVTITAAGLGLPPYLVLLKKIDSTGTAMDCGKKQKMLVGLQRYRTKASGGAFTLAIRAQPVVDPFLGYTYTGNIDETNDCANEEDCQGADDPSMACVHTLEDGGVELFDGTVVTPTTVTPTDGGDPYEAGLVDPMDGGDSYEVDLANECGAVDEPIERRDPADPDGKNLTVIGDMPQFPTAGTCDVTNLKGGVENFQEERLVDGTVLPAVKFGVEWTDFKVLNTTKIPGTAFTGKVKISEEDCVANYDALGFWPGSFAGVSEIACTPSDPSKDQSYAPECDPVADTDGGTRIFGSGINPDFAPVCDKNLEQVIDGTTFGTCVPGVDLTTLK